MPAVFPVALWLATAMEVHTSKEVDAVNGTNLRLKCTFSSSSPVSQHLSVTWNFQPEDQSSHEPVRQTFTLRFIDARLPKQTTPKAQHWVSPGTAAIPGVGMGKHSQTAQVCASWAFSLRLITITLSKTFSLQTLAKETIFMFSFRESGLKYPGPDETVPAYTTAEPYVLADILHLIRLTGCFALANVAVQAVQLVLPYNWRTAERSLRKP